MKRTYSSGVSYGEIKDLLQKQFFDLEDELFSELERAYKSKCQNRIYRNPSKYQQELNLEDHIQCSMDLQRLYKGRAEVKNVLRGRLKVSDFPEIKLKKNQHFRVTNSPNFSVDFQLKTEPFKITLLDFKKAAWSQNQARLFSSFTLQHTPLYRSSAQYMCLTLPGMKISTNMGTLLLEDGRRVGRTVVSMNLGGLEFDRILMCGVLSLNHPKDYHPLDTDSAVSTSFKKMNVKYVNIRAYGPKIQKIQPQGQKIKDIQPYNLSQQLTKAVSEAASEKISAMISSQWNHSLDEKQRELVSGELWKTLYNRAFHGLHSPMASVMFNEMKNHVTVALTPKQESLKTGFGNACVAAQEYMSSRTWDKVSCNEALVETAYHGFDPESSSKKSGCYEHSFEVIESPKFLEALRNDRRRSAANSFRRIPGNDWWKDDCIFATSQSVLVHRDYEEAMNCVAQHTMSNQTEGDIARLCLGAFLAPPTYEPVGYRTRRYPASQTRTDDDDDE